MVGLLPDRPQRGKSGIRDLQRLVNDFENQFTGHCVDAEQGRLTADKALQSWLIRDAHTQSWVVPIRLLQSRRCCARATRSPATLHYWAPSFV